MATVQNSWTKFYLLTIGTSSLELKDGNRCAHTFKTVKQIDASLVQIYNVVAIVIVAANDFYCTLPKIILHSYICGMTSKIGRM